MTINDLQCLYCKHFIGLSNHNYRCEAFPKKIPWDILTSKHNHREPYQGDNGIQFEPIKEEEHARQ